MLDTNIVSELVRRPQGLVTDRIAKEGEESVCTSIVVAAELRFGAKKKGSARLARQLEAVLSAIPVLPLEKPADEQYARLRHALEKAGTPIGPNDMLIAAHALSQNLAIVTANRREFSRVAGLAVENWLEVG
mgnify:FL=1